MTDRNSNDLPGAPGGFTDSRDRFELAELASMLDAPVERVRQWLSDEDIRPLDVGQPDTYGVDAFEYLRMRRHQI